MASDDAATRRLMTQPQSLSQPQSLTQSLTQNQNQNQLQLQLQNQNQQITSYSFQPSSFQQPRETQQRNYVFVDEHNRHTRLKVMRACEGCRRRKIKCDAATTNTWPCSACVRLKLQCVRPTGYDDSSDPQAYDEQPQLQAQPQQQIQSQPPQQALPAPPQALPLQHPHQALYSTSHAFSGQLDPATGAAIDVDQPALYAAQTTSAGYPTPTPAAVAAASTLYAVPYGGDTITNLHYTTVPPPPPPPPPPAPQLTTATNPYTTPQHSTFSTPTMPQGSHPDSPSDSAYITDEQAAYRSDLADLLGNLRMNEAGTAPYLNNRILASMPTAEEPPMGDDDDYKSTLPPLVTGPGLKVRIPPELMPDDETTLKYFDLYFIHVHPFCPILDKASFYHQWHTNRDSLSPLLIESLLAMGGRLAEEPSQGQQWLALATRHADSFKDMPRLSTLQALLIMLKAREAAPKRGYYYRSWISIVECVQMAKVLGLDEHYADHEAGRPCGSTPAECLMRTRIWQTIFICEVMIGSPQGRLDLSVPEDTVDLHEPAPTPGVEESDMQISRNFVYFARIVSIVARMTLIYARLKRNKDWGTDPEFTKMKPLLHAWINELPADMKITYPQDGSPPWIPSAFIGNIHSYYHLSVLLLHRPQLQVFDHTSPDGRWKHHMMVCYSSARTLCRLEEAVLRRYGLDGLRNMLRGINFTIYCVLTSILIHLVALTSPDPDLNSEAREYFTRHIRILEQCMSVWPMPDMQRQVDSMRVAFSADIRKPFVLKPTFPYGSPSPPSQHATPPRQHTGLNITSSPTTVSFHADHIQGQSVEQIIQQQHRQQQQHHRQQQQQQQQQQQIRHVDTALAQHHANSGYANNPISPPITSTPTDVGGLGAAISVQPMGLMTTPTAVSDAQAAADVIAMAPGWNPSRIFDQWNTTFGTQQVHQAHFHPGFSQTSPLSAPSSSGSVEAATLQDIQVAQAGLQQDLSVPGSITFQAVQPIQPQPSFVTPAMWQESVASVYEGGMKRSWDYDPESMPIMKH